jgi:hypothetical protein
MSQYNDGVRTLQAGEALAKHRLVKLDAAARDVVYADAADGLSAIGSTEYAVANDEQVAVRLCNAPGTCKLVASAAITVNAKLKAANDGKIAAAGTTATETVIGLAIEAATADNDIIECLLFPSPRIMNLS